MSTAPKPVSADPVHVDSKHYTVEAENDRVRVLRVKYGPREKSISQIGKRIRARRSAHLNIRLTVK